MMQLTRRSVGDEFALREMEYGVWQAHVDESWRGWTGPHGGALAGLMVAIAQRATGGELAVRAVDMRFLGRPVDGDFTFRLTAQPVGRSTVVVDVVAYQGSGAVTSAAITVGRTAASTVPDQPGTAELDVPPAADCALFALPPEIVPVGAHFEVRPAAGPLPLSGAEQAWLCAWIRLIPDLSCDAAALAILADALPPAVFPLLTQPVPIPTVAFSMHLHSDLTALPVGPVLVRAVNATTGGGWSVDDIDIRDSAGRLLATARQTRRVLG